MGFAMKCKPVNCEGRLFRILGLYLVVMIVLCGCHSDAVPFSEAATNSNIEGSTEVSSLSLQETKALDLKGLEDMSITSGSNETTKTNEKTNTNETAKNNVTTIEDGKVTFSKEGLYIGDLREEVELIFGVPVMQDSVAGMSVAEYKQKDNFYTNLGYVAEHLAYIETNHPNMVLPGDVGVNRSLMNAFEQFPIAKEQETLGFNQNMTPEAFKKAIVERQLREMSFVYDDSLLITLDFNFENMKIHSVGITDYTKKQKPIQFELKDLELTPLGLVEKYGYPIEIRIYSNEAAELAYGRDIESNTITILNTTKEFRNKFWGSKEEMNPHRLPLEQAWTGPYGIVAGNDVRKLIRQLGLPINNEICMLSLEMTDAEMAKALQRDQWSSFLTFYVDDVKLTVSYNHQSFKINSWWIIPRDTSVYKIDKKHVSFELPDFDPEAMVTREDIYLSNLSFGSSRKEVFEQLGAPIAIDSDYEEMMGMYQVCTFKEGQVTFLSVEDYDDLNSGHAIWLQTRTKHLVGPRGISVGDPIEKLLKLIPGTNDINFNTVGLDTQIYPYPYKEINEINSASVSGDHIKSNTGVVYIHIDWYMSISIFYEDGIVTGIDFGQMLD